MITPEPQIQYPLFLECANKAAFEALEQQACDLLGLPNAGAQNYCNPIIDKYGNHYFTINSEVVGIFSEEQLSSAVEYSVIEFEVNKMP